MSIGRHTKTNSEHSENSSMLVSSVFYMNDISHLWELVAVSILNPEKQKENETESDTMSKFLETVDIEGKYEVGLTCIDGHPPLQNNFDLAKKRLESVRKI